MNFLITIIALLIFSIEGTDNHYVLSKKAIDALTMDDLDDLNLDVLEGIVKKQMMLQKGELVRQKERGRLYSMQEEQRAEQERLEKEERERVEKGERERVEKEQKEIRQKQMEQQKAAIDKIDAKNKLREKLTEKITDMAMNDHYDASQLNEDEFILFQKMLDKAQKNRILHALQAHHHTPRYKRKPKTQIDRIMLGTEDDPSFHITLTNMFPPTKSPETNFKDLNE